MILEHFLEGFDVLLVLDASSSEIFLNFLVGHPAEQGRLRRHVQIQWGDTVLLQETKIDGRKEYYL